jgi:hypothetical protein
MHHYNKVVTWYNNQILSDYTITPNNQPAVNWYELASFKQRYNRSYQNSEEIRNYEREEIAKIRNMDFSQLKGISLAVNGNKIVLPENKEEFMGLAKSLIMASPNHASPSPYSNNSDGTGDQHKS